MSTPARTPVTVAALLLVVVGAAIHAGGIDAPFIYDDGPAIVDNDSIRALASAATPPRGTPVAGRPVVSVSLALNYALGGLDPRGYRVVNIAVHVLAALVLFGIVRRTLLGPVLSSRFGRHATALGFACGLVWMVHPLQTECVAYVAQRTESMMALFYLLTVYCAIRAADARRPAGWCVLAVIACGLGMGSKESMVTAPLMVVAYDWAYRSRPFAVVFRSRRWLYLALAATWVVLAALMTRGPRAETVGFGHGVSGWQYALNQCVVITHYLRLVVWPSPLVIDYGFPRPITAAQAAPYAIVVTGLVATAALWFLRRPASGFPAVWVFAVLAPTSSLVPIATEVAAERRMYLPLAGLVVLAVVGVYGIAFRWPVEASPGRTRRPLTGAVLTIALLSAVAGLSWTAWRRTMRYHRPLEIWALTVAAVPDNHRALTNYGIALAAAGRLDEAVRRLTEAVDVNPDSPRARYNLGLALAQQGALADAVTHLRAVIDTRPEHAAAHYNLAKALALTGGAVEARRHFERAVGIDPDRPATLRDAAWLLATWPDPQVRDGQQAVRLAERAAALTLERDPAVLDVLAAAYAEAGDFDRARRTAGRAAALAEGELAAAIETRLELYRVDRPFRVTGGD